MSQFMINNRSPDGSTYFDQTGIFNWLYAPVIEMVSNGLSQDYFTIQLSPVPGFPQMYVRLYGDYTFVNRITSIGNATHIQAGSIINRFEIIDGTGKVYDSFTALNLATNKDMTTIANEPINVFATSFRPGEVPDLFAAFAGNDLVIGNSGNEVLRGYEGNDEVRGLNGADTLYGDGGNDTLIGGDGADELRGGTGNDTIVGYTVGDFIDGGADFDTWSLTGIYTAGFSLPLKVDMRAVTFYDIEAIKVTYGDLIFNSNQIGGSSTVQTIIGGSQYRDTFTVTAPDPFSAVGVTINLSGVAFQNWNVNTQDADYVTIEGTQGGDTIDGSSQNDSIFAFDGLNVVRGNGGDDYLSGGGVSDILRGGDGGDRLAGWSGADILIGDDDYLQYPAARQGDDTLYGMDGDDTLIGLGGFNLIDGGTDNDTVDYGFKVNNVDNLGNILDVFVTINLSSLVDFNDVNGGFSAYIDIDFGDVFIPGARDKIINVENVDGSDYSDTIIGNSVANRLRGEFGNDNLFGQQGNDRLEGGDGIDTLDGGADIDQLFGGNGDDVYVVDNTLDAVVEDFGRFSGFDHILSSVTYTLAANVERLTLTGYASINATGRALVSDTLTGNSGSNYLNGLTGVDTMAGGDGSDVYYAEVFNDVVIETNTVLATGGNDLVYFYGSSGTFTLGQNVERLALTGSAAINGTGNALGNTFIGNAAANTLSGLGGNDVFIGGGGIDTMIGGDGSDAFYADVFNDVATETNAVLATGGNDIVVFSGTVGTYVLGLNVERLAITGVSSVNGTGNTLANTLTGNRAANTLSGLGGNDLINGGLGNDLLIGGTGLDTFVFTTATGAANIDSIVGFVAADDTIQLDNAIFAGLGLATGALAAGMFNTGAAATQADDRIIYNAATGALFYDADGLNGVAGVQFATLGGAPSLSALDFVVI